MYKGIKTPFILTARTSKMLPPLKVRFWPKADVENCYCLGNPPDFSPPCAIDCKW